MRIESSRGTYPPIPEPLAAVLEHFLAHGEAATLSVEQVRYWIGTDRFPKHPGRPPALDDSESRRVLVEQLNGLLEPTGGLCFHRN
jgi:hypothetical protein